MNSEDIKIGETYNLRIQVLGKSEDFIHARPITPNGEYATTGFLEILHKYAPSFTPIPSKHGTSVPTTTRLFREGDKVRVVEKDGRTPTCFPVGKIKVGDILTVIENERGDAFINVKTEDGSKMMAPWFHLELVTPVEELEPYKLIDSPNTYNIVRDSAMVMTIHKKSHPNAKAAAEAECARLNEEWRKEQNNG